ncbi:CLUMA_CG016908, isoform A [Clunio marinus]|uniref:CLUMA_CG016908, isoform A n=1 Tax=Clunio marinus TaxID=568069 RepID=A0A1J1IT48_9DIPT|nr:CLUMA_CG016908, isoform A [Clunio marinus]
MSTKRKHENTPRRFIRFCHEHSNLKYFIYLQILLDMLLHTTLYKEEGKEEKKKSKKTKPRSSITNEKQTS